MKHILLGLGFSLLIALSGICIRSSLPSPIPSTPTSTSPAVWTQTPSASALPAWGEASETLQILLQTDLPIRDLRDLAIRYRGLSPETPETACHREGDLPVGARRAFLVSNNDTSETFTVTAVLWVKTPHLYLWVEEDRHVNPADLEAAAATFEQRIYPTVCSFFGSEWTPGVDCDPRLVVLHAAGMGGVAGYYASKDEFPKAVRPDSNEAEMFYINLDAVRVNSAFYNGVLAHEFQHMVHWHNDRNEETWLNEGASELAAFLSGYGGGGFELSFLARPDTQLNTWAPQEEGNAEHYGAAFLFMEYFLERFGEEATRRLIAHPENGLAAVDQVLKEIGAELDADAFFLEWVAANFLDHLDLSDGPRYHALRLPAPNRAATVRHLPQEIRDAVFPYATDYMELPPGEALRLIFQGTPTLPLVPASPFDGHRFWYAVRGDEGNPRLTRAVDLRGVSRATLRYRIWYDLEEDWDYAYVSVSTDGGQRWTLLRTPSGTDTNPHHNNLGWGYTGVSGGDDRPRWITETVDLTPYAGQEILLRFEVVTDDAVNRPGVALDALEIPEIGFWDSAETDLGWQAEGWARVTPQVPVRFALQVLRIRRDGTVRIERLPIGEEAKGEWILEGGPDRRAVLALSALARFTTEPALYTLRIERP
ncbi:immune inhibitor A [Thermoflexus sp.]|uniref:immune inhibitor A n=1 Tax=Thermoflexus sp. TaxID=1969742 RepID=UPI002ADDE807|nr:immune inhibitor A [Thermoflexus sp.]